MTCGGTICIPTFLCTREAKKNMAHSTDDTDFKDFCRWKNIRQTVNRKINLLLLHQPKGCLEKLILTCYSLRYTIGDLLH